ncbi:MAG: helix-turn-helix domain-containing protein, partial [Lysobacter sp.]
ADLGLPAAAVAAPALAEEPDRAGIEAALQRNAGVVAQAASELGLSRQALYRRMERLGIERAQ